MLYHSDRHSSVTKKEAPRTVDTDRINVFFKEADIASHPYSDDEWLSVSDTIRRYHELTHFICRKKFPDKKDPIWDELVADTVGIYAAFGSFDRRLEALFLGIDDGGYTKGRLENYVKADSAEEKQRQLDELSLDIMDVLKGFETTVEENQGITPYKLAILLNEPGGGRGQWSISENLKE